MRMPQPGQSFEGKYEILETLGQGGFAHVYRAHDVEVGRDVAIKVLTPRDIGGYDPQLESRFTREARVIAGLQDSHTITMYEFGTSPEGLMYMVFEYVRGQDLSVVLKRQHSLSPEIAEHILRQLLSALGEAHARGVLHRDIKPANVIIFEYMDDPWRAKLLDFGIAKPMPEPGGRDFTQLTRDGVVVGTPRYMAPEQFFGETLTARVDIYGLGLLVFEMLAGRPAISGTTSQETLRMAVSTERLVLPPIRGAETLARIVEQMIEREPKKRYGSADEVLAALDAARYSSTDDVATDRRAPSFSSSSGYPTAPRGPHDPSYSEPYFSTRTRRARGRSVMLFVLGLCSLAAVATIGLVIREQRSNVPTPQPPTRRNVPFISGVADEIPTPAEPAPVAAEAVDMGPTDGCGNEPARTGFLQRRADLGFGSGAYTVYLPPTYDPHRRHSVVMMFHNALGSGRKVIDNTRYDEIARREQIVLIAPTSNGDSTRPWYSPDDIDLARTAYAQSRQEFCLDDTHVYGLGHGGGGNFVADLRCQFPMSGIAFTAVGEHITQAVCETEHPIPTMRMWGNTDRHVPARGGTGCWDQNTFRSASEVRQLWQQRNETRRKGSKWVDHAGGVCTLFEGKAKFVDCELNGGHDWPTAPAKVELPNCGGAPPPDFPVGETIWKFFSEHGIPRIDAGAVEAVHDAGVEE